MKTTLLKTLLLVFAFCFASTYLSAQTLTAHYKFDNSLNDETGNWDLSPSSGFTPTFETGQDGTENGAVSGFGAANFLQTATNFDISGNTSRSMTAWVKVSNTVSGGTAILGTGIRNSAGERWSFLIDPAARPRVEIQGQGFNNDPNTVEIDTWAHVAVVWDASVNSGGATGGESVKLYLNGQPGNTATWTDNDVMTAVSRLRIGNDFNSQTPARGFQGALDDIQVYEGALTDAQVLDIYNGDPICVSPANLMASNVTGTSADLSWDNEGVASGGYEYFVTSDGTVPDSSTTPTGTVSASTTTTTLSGLNEGTSYKVYIRSLCNGSNVSEYSEPLTISTPLSDPILVAHYKFENSLDDETGNWDLSPSSGFTPTFETGQNGTENGAISGFGDSDFLETATDFVISGNTSRTMTAWVRIDDDTRFNAILGLGTPVQNPGGRRWTFGVNPNRNSRVEIQGEGLNNEAESIDLGVWVHLAVTFDSNSNLTQLYLNGEPGDSDFFSTVDTELSVLRVGNDLQATIPVRGFTGALDEVRVYQGALSDAEIKEIYDTTESNPVFANLQVIHNSPDAAASSVDIYVNGDLLPELTGVEFRTASEFLQAPANEETTIDVVPAGADLEDSVFTESYTLDEDESYIIVANGLVGPDFELSVFAGAKSVADNETMVDVLVHHGSPDAPAVDVGVQGGGLIINTIAYSEFEGYQAVDEANIVLELFQSGSTDVVKAYQANLADLNLAGNAITIIASGFFGDDATENNSFGLWVATAAGGTLIELEELSLNTSSIDFDSSNFSYYPVPVKANLNIQSSSKVERVEIFNVLGQRIMSVQPKTQMPEVNMQSLKTGVYLMKVQINGNQETFQIIKE